MKHKLFVLLSALLLSGTFLSACSTPSYKETITVYKDSSDADIGELHVDVDNIAFSIDYSKENNGYKTTVSLRIKNKSEKEQKINIKDSFISCENDSASFVTTVKLDKEVIGNNEVMFAKYIGATSTPLNENNYSFSTVINDIRYLVHIYDKPDNERNDLKVEYKIADKVVHSILVKESRIIGEDYIYENPNHLTFSNVWKINDDIKIGSSTTVNSDILATGIEKDNIYFMLDEEEYVATSLDYIPSDRIVVVPSVYSNKNVTTIGENFFFSKSVKAIYLPKSIKTIEENNFYACSLLETINYEGSEEEWNAINNLSFNSIPDSVTINFETVFNS